MCKYMNYTIIVITDATSMCNFPAQAPWLAVLTLNQAEVRTAS